MKLINGGTAYTNYGEFVALIRKGENDVINALKKQRALALAGKPVGIQNQVTLQFTLVSVNEITVMIDECESKRYDVDAPASKIVEEIIDMLVDFGWVFPEINVGRPEDSDEDENIFLSFFTDKHEIVFSVRENMITSASYEYATDEEEDCSDLTVADMRRKIMSFFQEGTVFSADTNGFEDDNAMSEVIAKMLKDLL